MFVDYEAGFYRAIVRWPCHEGIKEFMKTLILCSTIPQGIHEFIDQWGSSRILLQGLNTDKDDSKYSRTLASKTKRQKSKTKGRSQMHHTRHSGRLFLKQ